MNKYYILLACLFITISSCKKGFLNVPDNSVVLGEQYVKDLSSTQNYLNGIYVLLGKDFYQYSTQIYTDLIADNVKPITGSTATMLSQYNWNQSTTNGLFTIWQLGYKVARACSFVIDKAEEFKAEDMEKANQMQAEAYAIRALVHFVIVNVFAQSYNYSDDASHPGVPYITVFDWTQPVTRISVAEVYTNMINDLNQSLALYTAQNVNTLVMNQRASKALLARIYLFMGDWSKAKNMAIEVLNAVPIMIGSAYPSKLFTTQETEALFQLAPASTTVLAGGYTTNYAGRYYNNAKSTLYLASTDIANLLRQNTQDVRKNWVKSGGTAKDTIVKFPVNVIAGFNPTSGSYYPTILRSSEMALTAAEASAKLGEEATAKTYLDAIRKRANTTLGNSTATGAALLDSIYLERRKELAFEGLRMFDMQRWKKNIVRTDPLTPDATTLTYPNDRAIAPIPPLDAAMGIEQNPAYR
jgi:hypothetical protein